MAIVLVHCVIRYHSFSWPFIFTKEFDVKRSPKYLWKSLFTVCFTHVTIIHNLLTYLLICTAMMSYYIECEDMNVPHVEQDVLPFRSTWVHPSLLWGSCCSIFFLHVMFCRLICPYVLFLLDIVLVCPTSIDAFQNNQYHDKAQDVRNLGKKRSSINILKSWLQKSEQNFVD
jgi:hypothetical protein